MYKKVNGKRVALTTEEIAKFQEKEEAAALEKQEQDRVEYRIKRKPEYRQVGDQLDDLWHAMDHNILPRIEPFYTENKKIKDKYPKPIK